MKMLEKIASSEFRVARGRRNSFPALLAVSVLLAGALIAPAKAAVFYNVSFNDPANEFASFYPVLALHTLAAGAEWASRLSSVSNVSLEVEIQFGAIPTAQGGSVTSSFLRNNGVYNVFEQGAAAEIRTGVDPNGALPDIRFTIGTNYLSDELFFSPDPFDPSVPVPPDRTDAVSVLMHEFGHAWGFNGWRDPFNGSLPGDYESTYDEPQMFDGTNSYFTGATATALYGGPVPLTLGSPSHIGNPLPGSGSDLEGDLMGGFYFQRGFRYSISPLDLAILHDTGVPLNFVPEPSTWVLAAMAMVSVAIAGARRSPTRRAAVRPLAAALGRHED